MLRRILITAGLFAVTSLVQAGEAGHVVFVVGQVNNASHPIALGDAIQEGDEITTGSDGYMYLKTIDDGFLILRPGSRARIVAYHIDAQNPANTRVKLELLSGVARAISGQGVKQSRQNFRFNTPVAAIGVRGTDFTVFTDQETSRVAVISGGVVVSGFAGTCGPEGNGPCEGKATRELFANQVGQLLQVRKGQAAPQLLPSRGISPDVNGAPRSDEPSGKGASTSNGSTLAANDVSLDAQKSANLLTMNVPVPVITPPVTPVIPPVTTPEQQREIIWGRWQAVLDKNPNIDISKIVDANGGQSIYISPYYFAVLRSKGADWQTPTQGSIGFALRQSEAYIVDDFTRTPTAAKLENGQLQVDFAKATFSTSFDLLSQQNERFKFQALGDVSRSGQLFGAGQFSSPTNMAVNGVIGPENGGSAAYVFQGNIDPQGKRFATGVTYWTK